MTDVCETYRLRLCPRVHVGTTAAGVVPEAQTAQRMDSAAAEVV